MGYSVFLSHSMGEADRHIVEAAVEHARLRGVEFYIAERDPQYGRSLCDKISGRIRGSECLVVLWTNGGADSHWVNQEVGMARQAGKLIIPVVEDGADSQGLWSGIEHIKLDRDDPGAAIGLLTQYLANLKVAKAQREFAQAVIIGLALAVVIYGLSKGSEGGALLGASLSV